MINQKRRIYSSAFKQQITVKIANELETDFTEEIITAIVIPVSPQNLQLLPEAERSIPSVQIFSDEKLKLGDRVVLDDEYRITVANNWSDYGYFDSIATRVIRTQKNNSGGFVVT